MFHNAEDSHCESGSELVVLLVVSGGDTLALHTKFVTDPCF